MSLDAAVPTLTWRIAAAWLSSLASSASRSPPSTRVPAARGQLQGVCNAAAATLLLGMERVEEALRESRHANEQDALAMIVGIIRTRAFQLARDWAAAIAQYRRTLEIDGSWTAACAQTSLSYAQQGMHSGALREVSKALESATHPRVWPISTACTRSLAVRRGSRASPATSEGRVS